MSENEMIENEMTANELADELVWMAKNRGDSISRQLADIVRQQQAEIEALKSDTIPYKDLHQVVKNVLAGGTPDSELAEHKRIIREQQAEIDRLKSLCISYIDEEWSGTSSYQNKIDEVNLGHFKESE